MTFKAIIYEHFGTMAIFGKSFGVTRMTAAKYFHDPEELTINQLKLISKACGIPITDLVKSISQ